MTKHYIYSFLWQNILITNYKVLHNAPSLDSQLASFVFTSTSVGRITYTVR